MKLYFDKLDAHLRQGLQPVYLLSGDEPLQLMEAGDAIRRRARETGFAEREVLHVEPGFDWNTLLASSGAMSLFAEQRLLELRMPGGKPGREGGKILAEYAANPPPDTVLLIISGKLDSRQQQSKWYKAIDKAGVVMTLWPIEASALPEWVMRRMRGRGLQPTPEAARLLAERVEGNMLAAVQEIEKLRLRYGECEVDVAMVEEGVIDSARYGLFELVDTALLGNVPRISRAMQGLRAEGVEPVLVLWALLRELRVLVQLSHCVEQGASIDSAFGRFRIWQTRKAAVRAALQRHTGKRWQLLVRRAGRIDRIIKGAEPGSPWDELLQLTLLMAGVRTV